MVVYIKNHFSQCRTDFGKVDTKNSVVEEKYKVHSFFFSHMCGSFSRPHKIAKTLPQKLNKLFFTENAPARSGNRPLIGHSFHRRRGHNSMSFNCPNPYVYALPKPRITPKFSRYAAGPANRAIPIQARSTLMPLPAPNIRK